MTHLESTDVVTFHPHVHELKLKPTLQAYKLSQPVLFSTVTQKNSSYGQMG